jgi:hypothetical protein
MIYLFDSIYDLALSTFNFIEVPISFLIKTNAYLKNFTLSMTPIFISIAVSVIFSSFLFSALIQPNDPTTESIILKNKDFLTYLQS